jgi:hypothetical protein
MEARSGILGRLFEKTLGWIVLGVLIALGIGIWQLGPDGRQAMWQGIWRTGLWLLIVAALPWSARLFIRRLLELRTNWAGAGLVAAFVLIDAIVGVVLLQGLPVGLWSWLLALAALAVAGTYTYLVSEYLADEAGI